MKGVKLTILFFLIIAPAAFAQTAESVAIQKPHTISLSYGYGNLLKMEYSDAGHAFSLGYSYRLNKYHSFGIITTLNYYDNGYLVIPTISGAWGELDYRMWVVAPYMGISEKLSKNITSELFVGPGYYILTKNQKSGNYVTGVSDTTTTHYDAIGAYFGIKLTAKLSSRFGFSLALNGYFPFFDLIDSGGIMGPDVSGDFKSLVPMLSINLSL
ncbi:MAG: hypothetical protein CVT49_04730 [candidate division Zixibacteria bacterium HGW-Zixibacteria-1]|nr:MAG: hypothetical protein CVT49_04730 [candidate division Zixibacteria bacterium HGW-Zixibacteria-1]